LLTPRRIRSLRAIGGWGGGNVAGNSVRLTPCDRTGDVDFSVGIIALMVAEWSRSHSGNLEEGFDHSPAARILADSDALAMAVAATWSGHGRGVADARFAGFG